MKISQEDVILIKNLYLSKQYGARRLWSELSDNIWLICMKISGNIAEGMQSLHI